MKYLMGLFLLCCLQGPAIAQVPDGLIGTWEARYTDVDGTELTSQLTFRADSTFAFDYTAILAPAFREYLAAAGLELEAYTASGTGVYQVEGESLFLQVLTTQSNIDGEDVVIVLTAIARVLFEAFAELADISEEEYAALEEEFVTEFLAGADEQELIANSLPLETAFVLDGDNLFLTDEEFEETTRYLRVSETAVAQASWGSIKAQIMEK